MGPALDIIEVQLQVIETIMSTAGVSERLIVHTRIAGDGCDGFDFTFGETYLGATSFSDALPDGRLAHGDPCFLLTSS